MVVNFTANFMLEVTANCRFGDFSQLNDVLVDLSIVHRQEVGLIQVCPKSSGPATTRG